MRTACFRVLVKVTDGVLEVSCDQSEVDQSHRGLEVVSSYLGLNLRLAKAVKQEDKRELPKFYCQHRAEDDCKHMTQKSKKQRNQF